MSSTGAIAEQAIEVGTVEELQDKGVKTLTAKGRTIAVFWHEGKPFAVDNRCPHMGFP